MFPFDDAKLWRLSWICNNYADFQTSLLRQVGRNATNQSNSLKNCSVKGQSEHLALPSEATLSQTSKLDGVRLSPHLSLAEMSVTNVKNVSNLPGPEEIENLKRLCGWLEHLRDMYNILYGNGKVPIVINSGFRSPEVNKRVGGSLTSNHLTGCAADIKVFGIEQAMRIIPCRSLTSCSSNVRRRERIGCISRLGQRRIAGRSVLYKHKKERLSAIV